MCCSGTISIALHEDSDVTDELMAFYQAEVIEYAVRHKDLTYRVSPVPVVFFPRIKGTGMFFYSTVSSPFDRSQRFTRHPPPPPPPGRPVHSGTNSTSLGSIVATQQLRAKIIHPCSHRCLMPGTHLYS